MPLVEHIRELRKRLLISAVALLVGVVACYVSWEPIFHFLREPYCRANPHRSCDLIVTGVFDAFNTKLRVSFIGGIVTTSPIWLYQIGAFITPALHKQERRYAGGFLVGALSLFLTGCVLGFLSVGHGLKILLHIAGPGVQNLLTLDKYFSFLTLMLLLFGVAFEFPVIVVFLNLTGLLTFERMVRWQRGMIFGLFLAAAVLTPSTDPFTFLFLGLALVVLWELCVGAAWIRSRRQKARGPDQDDLSPDEPSYVDPTPSELAP
ncbi:MAG: preprotein translocase subunit TatC [Frankiales bacterium]|nr:preprotein translocase subunit TatC [Frankiales bacterium]